MKFRNVLVNALFASVFTFAASCLSASVTSKRNFDMAGEGGWDVAAVESLGDVGIDEESLMW